MDYNTLFNQSQSQNETISTVKKLQEVFPIICFFHLIVLAIPGNFMTYCTLSRAHDKFDSSYRSLLLVIANDILSSFAHLLLVIFWSNMDFVRDWFSISNSDWDFSRQTRGVMLFEAHFAIFLVNLFFVAAMCIMIFVGVDRIQAYRSPYQYSRANQLERVNVMGICSYIVAVLTSVHEGFHQKVTVVNKDTDEQAVWPNFSFDDTNTSMWLRVAALGVRAIAWLILILLFLVIMYFSCCYKWSVHSAHQTPQKFGQFSSVTRLGTIKMALTLILVLPQLFTYSAIIFTTNKTLVQFGTCMSILCSTLLISYNFIVCFIFDRVFRSTFCELICCCCKRNTTANDSGKSKKITKGARKVTIVDQKDVRNWRRGGGNQQPLLAWQEDSNMTVTNRFAATGERNGTA